jgi:predicted transcriptional regulator
MRLRDVADHVGITERGVQKIVGELEAAQVIQIQKDGRRNRYHINKTLPLRHPVESHKKVQDLLNAVL